MLPYITLLTTIVEISKYNESEDLIVQQRRSITKIS